MCVCALLIPWCRHSPNHRPSKFLSGLVRTVSEKSLHQTKIQGNPSYPPPKLPLNKALFIGRGSFGGGTLDSHERWINFLKISACKLSKILSRKGPDAQLPFQPGFFKLLKLWMEQLRQDYVPHDEYLGYIHFGWCPGVWFKRIWFPMSAFRGQDFQTRTCKGTEICSWAECYLIFNMSMFFICVGSSLMRLWRPLAILKATCSLNHGIKYFSLRVWIGSIIGSFIALIFINTYFSSHNHGSGKWGPGRCSEFKWAIFHFHDYGRKGK